MADSSDNHILNRLHASCARCGAPCKLPVTGMSDYLTSGRAAAQVSTEFPCEKCASATVVIRERPRT
jgi:hypothetical protein